MVSAKWTMGVAVAALMAGEARADLVISTKPPKNVSCSGGVCTSTAPNAVMNVADLVSELAAGDVTMKTGGGATNIVVNAGMRWGNASRLTLDANQSVEIDKPVSVTGTGAVTITTNDGGAGGDLMFDGNGNVKFWDTASSLVINGNSYTLVKDIATLASDIAASPSGFYALANDYDASVDGTYSSAPITTTFGGIFEGLGHKVENLSINSSDNLIGPFALVTGVLRDVGVTSLVITGNNTGGAGGGLLAESKLATVVGCYTTGSIDLPTAAAVGGLMGTVWFTTDGTVTRSHSSVSVVAPKAGAAGGLVGASGLAISLSYATGSVSAGDGSSAGGLIGSGVNDISRSYATGSIIAGENSNVGGLLGLGSGSIVNSYATGPVKGGDAAIVGGFAGQTGGLSMGSLYSMGRVKSATGGGFLGSFSNNESTSRSYWNINTSGKGKHQGCRNGPCGSTVKGLRTDQFLSGLPEGFDPSIWSENASINGGFPYLLALPPK